MSDHVIKIRELDLELIAPCTAKMNEADYGGSKLVVIGKPGCFSLGTEILMFDGSIKKVEDVQVGDQVMGWDSTPRKVLELCRNKDIMYEVTSNRSPEENYIVNSLHSLVLYDGKEITEMPVYEYLKQTPEFKQNKCIFRKSVEFPEIEMDDSDIYNTGYIFGKHINNYTTETIPREYKMTSIEKRMTYLDGLLRGISTNKHFVKVGWLITDLTITSPSLKRELLFLLRSVGYDCFATISGICMTERSAINSRSFDLKDLGEGDYYGFTLDGDHRFFLASLDVVRNTGKTTLIASILYAKKHIIPVGMVVSGTEDSNGFFRKIMPSCFVYNEYSEEQVASFVKRQKIAKQHLKNPWALMLLDDATDDPRIFNRPLQHGMYKRGRHFKMLYIVSLQYATDIKPVIRTNVDGIFILREPILRNRKSLWENYASIIPDFTLFCEILDSLDDYTALYIHNAGQSNVWQDCVFYYRAKKVPEDFQFGCRDYWDFHKARYDTNYVDPFDTA